VSDAGSSVREYFAALAAKREAHERDRAELQAMATQMRFAWAEGHDTLYKFKSLARESAAQVRDMIENSRIYFVSVGAWPSDSTV